MIIGIYINDWDLDKLVSLPEKVAKAVIDNCRFGKEPEGLSILEKELYKLARSRVRVVSMEPYDNGPYPEESDYDD